MPRYFFDVENGHRLFDPSGFVCHDDVSAMIRAAVLAIGISLDKPEDDPERHVAVINDQGHKIGDVPVYFKPSYENPANELSRYTGGCSSPMSQPSILPDLIGSSDTATTT